MSTAVIAAIESASTSWPETRTRWPWELDYPMCKNSVREEKPRLPGTPWCGRLYPDTRHKGFIATSSPAASAGSGFEK